MPRFEKNLHVLDKFRKKNTVYDANNIITTLLGYLNTNIDIHTPYL